MLVKKGIEIGIQRADCKILSINCIKQNDIKKENRKDSLENFVLLDQNAFACSMISSIEMLR